MPPRRPIPHTAAFPSGGLGGYDPSIPHGGTAAAPNGIDPFRTSERGSEDASQTTIQALEQLRRRSESSYEGRPACDNCRRRKTKCDRAQPICGRCAKLGRKCTRSDVLMRRAPPSNKERAAYQAAGMEIPSLKYRHRTRRAQNIGGSQAHASPHASASVIHLSSHNGSLASQPQGPTSMGPPQFSNTGPWGPPPASNGAGAGPFSAPQSSGFAAGASVLPPRYGPMLHTDHSSGPADPPWYRDHRRGYAGMDQPLARALGGSVSSAVQQPPAPQDLAQRRWSLLPPTSASLDGQVENETAENRFMATSYGVVDSRSSFSAASMSPRTRGGLLSQPPVARFAPEPYYVGGSYGSAGGAEASPSSATSLPPPTVGHETVATGMVASPLTDDASYGYTEPAMGYSVPPYFTRSYPPVMPHAPPFASTAPPPGPGSGPEQLPPPHQSTHSHNQPGLSAGRGAYDLASSYTRPGPGSAPGIGPAIGPNTPYHPDPYVSLEPTMSRLPAPQGHVAVGSGPETGPGGPGSGGGLVLGHLPSFP